MATKSSTAGKSGTTPRRRRSSKKTDATKTQAPAVEKLAEEIDSKGPSVAVPGPAKIVESAGAVEEIAPAAEELQSTDLVNEGLAIEETGLAEDEVAAQSSTTGKPIVIPPPSAVPTKVNPTIANILKTAAEQHETEFLRIVTSAAAGDKNLRASVTFQQLVDHVYRTNTPAAFRQLLKFMGDHQEYMTPQFMVTNISANRSRSIVELMISTMTALINPKRRQRLTANVVRKLRSVMTTPRFVSAFPEFVAEILSRQNG